MPRFEDGLTSDQAWAWIRSQEEARQLLAQGHALLVNARYLDPIQNTLLSSWAMGTEALLKVALGLRSLARGDGPLSQSKARSYGHDIEKMDADLKVEIATWMSEAPRSEYLRDLVSTVETDPVWPTLRRALHVYAKEGRFNNLDAMTGRTQADDAPSVILDQAAQLATETSDLTAAWRDIDHAKISPAQMDQFSLAIHAALAEPLVNWWFMITRLARHGFLGDRGRAFGADTEPQNALPPIKVRNHI